MMKQSMTAMATEKGFTASAVFNDAKDKDKEAEEDIIDLDSDYVVNALSEMKREYQNKISELSNFLGINSLAVDKESGVSDTEANSNRSFTTSNSNIYLRGREPLNMLNQRFNLDIQPYYDDEATSQIDIQNMQTDNYGGGSQ